MTAATYTTQGPSVGERGKERDKLIVATHRLLENCGIEHIGPRKVQKLVSDFQHRVERNGVSFVDFLANSVRLSADQRLKATRNPDLEWIFAHSDPTANTAIRNVMRGGAR